MRKQAEIGQEKRGQVYGQGEVEGKGQAQDQDGSLDAAEEAGNCHYACE